MGREQSTVSLDSTYQVMVSPLQMVTFAGINASSPESEPILTSLVSAAKAGFATAAAVKPAAIPAARDIAPRREQ